MICAHEDKHRKVFGQTESLLTQTKVLQVNNWPDFLWEINVMKLKMTRILCDFVVASSISKIIIGTPCTQYKRFTYLYIRFDI